MLDKCANPACSAKFRFLRCGKLFEIETESFGPSRADGRASGLERRVEFCWLCDLCARFYVLSCDGKQVTTSPVQLEKGRASAPITIRNTLGSEKLRVFVRPSLLRWRTTWSSESPEEVPKIAAKEFSDLLGMNDE